MEQVVVKNGSRGSAHWMTLDEVIQDTGIGRNTAYKLAKNNELPVPVMKMGKQYFISRAAWEALKVSNQPNTHAADQSSANV